MAAAASFVKAVGKLRLPGIFAEIIIVALGADE
jgi:hypothetical protein